MDFGFGNFDVHSFLQQLSVSIIPFLMAVTVHEVSHGYTAYLLGDNTAKNAGRLTLNPIPHIDPLGLACLLITRMFGWAKPVPVDFGVISRHKYGQFLVAVSGPVSNFVLAIFSSFLLVLLTFVFSVIPDSVVQPVALMLVISVKINVTLGIFNLLPILPLDGGRILESFLPRDMAYQYSKLEPYGMIIIIILLVTKVLSPILFFLINTVAGIILIPPMRFIM